MFYVEHCRATLYLVQRIFLKAFPRREEHREGEMSATRRIQTSRQRVARNVPRGTIRFALISCAREFEDRSPNEQESPLRIRNMLCRVPSPTRSRATFVESSAPSQSTRCPRRTNALEDHRRRSLKSPTARSDNIRQPFPGEFPQTSQPESQHR